MNIPIMKKIAVLIFFTIVTMLNALSQQLKIAYVTNKSSIEQIEDDDEKKAAEWFSQYYPENGNIISISNILDGSVDLKDFKVLWIAEDKETQTGDLDQEYTDVNFLSKLKQYFQNGGNLLLTNHAVQIINLIDRIHYKPNVINAGSAIQVNETWTINPSIIGVSNYRFHPLYDGLSSSNQYGYLTFRMINSGLKEDHNCLWDIDKLVLGKDKLTNFENQTDSRIIGTWGQNTDDLIAGIVEFFSNTEFKGRCISIGLGAYEWNKNDTQNLYQTNVEKMTSNALNYLTKDLANYAEPVLTTYYSMELNDARTSVTEEYSNTETLVNHSKEIRENVPGVSGNALRFDGFATMIDGTLNVDQINNNSFSASLWTALESYPMMNTDASDESYTFLAGNMNENSGFAFVINNNGKYGFQCFIDGVKYFCQANNKLTKYKWVNLITTVDSIKKEIVIRNNGVIVAKQSFSNSVGNMGPSNLMIGKNRVDSWIGPCRLNTINGLIDEIKVFSGVNAENFDSTLIENPADLSIPDVRFENEIQRPEFHGMPEANWTNEPHGLTYYNGKYHVFFQKNGNGPYWGRIHWGHIVSEDLISWKEVKTAIDPENSYDIKGAWSGCVFADAELTDNKPHIFYTSADYARATISEASPVDEDLLVWDKDLQNPIINGKPVGLDEDFRDPYIFKANDNFYMIVGSRKNGKGVTTLHRYIKSTKTWSNDGSVFFQSPSSAYGVFWEMPFVVPFDNGKYLFGTTQLGGLNGVEILYWIGTINQDGTFNPYNSTPKELELGNMSKQGYGMLSPSVMKKDGKIIAIGIVPDKLDLSYNSSMGWAHTFSLPREWQLNEDNELVQKPYSELTRMRKFADSFELLNTEITNSIHSMDPLSGMTEEIVGEFEIKNTTSKVGFNIRKSGSNQISIYYDKNSNEIVVDATKSRRWINDSGTYNGLYKTTLPESMNAGSILKMQVFTDHSIMDIFINDKWAFSVRLFPYKNDAVSNEFFVEGSVIVKRINGWKLDPKSIPNGINKASHPSVKVWLSDGKIRVDGLDDTYNITIFDSLGRRIFYTDDKSELKQINLPKRQIYLFKIVLHGESSVYKLLS